MTDNPQDTKPKDWPKDLPWPGKEGVEWETGVFEERFRWRWSAQWQGFAIQRWSESREQWVNYTSHSFIFNTIAAAFIERALKKKAEAYWDSQPWEDARFNACFAEIAQCRAWDARQRGEPNDKPTT